MTQTLRRTILIESCIGAFGRHISQHMDTLSKIKENVFGEMHIAMARADNWEGTERWSSIEFSLGRLERESEKLACDVQDLMQKTEAVNATVKSIKERRARCVAFGST